MRKVTLRTTMVLGGLVLVLLALGRWFDSRCEKSCLQMALHDSLEKGGNEFNFNFGDGDLNISSDDDAGPDLPASSPELPSLEGVDLITIKSVSTEWVVKQSAEKAKIDFSGGKTASATKIEKNDKTVSIEVKGNGPKNAEINLPPSFKGSLRIGTVSGEVHIVEALSLANLKVETASGDLDFAGWPSEKLEVNTVSGDMRSHLQTASVVPKTMDLQTVSGDFEVEFDKAFESLSAQTVSGNLRVKMPKSLGFSYQLHTISGNFSGVPPGGSLKEGFADKNLTGSFGNAVKASIHFESVSGDFEIELDETIGSR